MRDQARELGVQLKEAQALADSLAEELEDAKKHLNERTRDAESMRRLLAEENSRVDGQIQEIQSRLDAAIDERDRAEEELSREGRRRTREIEELKVRVRELEREVKTLSSQNDELEQREKDWAQRRQNLEQIEQKAAADDEEMRTTIFNLQNALDKSEQEVRGAEKRCVELRKLLDDTRTRFEKLKTQQQQQQQQQSRSSIDSNRTQNGSGPSVDVAYLKAVLLQFLELKGEMRPQMIPVLGKLLGFTADDNDKWMKVTQQLSTKSGR
ncbi:viral A-type inclusion protein repeat protein [Xylariaceae sp. FL1019]|nr:viral A-type inclusion protein repeat protein [Xylariaceae sp. FL1019]